MAATATSRLARQVRDLPQEDRDRVQRFAGLTPEDFDWLNRVPNFVAQQEGDILLCRIPTLAEGRVQFWLGALAIRDGRIGRLNVVYDVYGESEAWQSFQRLPPVSADVLADG